VSYQGNPVDPASVNRGRVNILNYKTGPDNVLGKVKFLFPNEHAIYVHGTVPFRKKQFNEPARMIGHEGVRMQKPPTVRRGPPCRGQWIAGQARSRSGGTKYQQLDLDWLEDPG
jgi:hypothetical protein